MSKKAVLSYVVFGLKTNLGLVKVMKNQLRFTAPLPISSQMY
ncbi:hypothetical protein FSS13T_09830 [Flavobacterium saliperosum S13]|uniref:Uncharacterized protein n=1 Tax=Flavobacterium saliperosum S13 TaxID=1341155 RepID=A0ABP3A419_9FLAO|nr:hypothetical protein FSS13T_09830 [Flavobacterium saliperosum S13]